MDHAAYPNMNTDQACHTHNPARSAMAVVPPNANSLTAVNHQIQTKSRFLEAALWLSSPFTLDLDSLSRWTLPLLELKSGRRA